MKLTFLIKKGKNMKVYQKIAGLLKAIKNCEKSNNNEWFIKHSERLEFIIDNYLPVGSGFDGQCFLQDSSNPEKLIFNHNYHCMDEHGFYDGWINLDFIITPSLQHGFNLRINYHGYSGKYKTLNDYFYDLWDNFLTQEVKE